MSCCSLRPGDFLTDDEACRAGWLEGLATAGPEVPGTEGEAAAGWDAVPWLGPGAYGDVNQMLGMFRTEGIYKMKDLKPH